MKSHNFNFNFTDEQMMGLGSFTAQSSSSSSSSSSNLSPLAPPFTVERSNHNKLNLSSSNRDSNFNDFTSPWPNFMSSTSTQALSPDSITTTNTTANTTYNWDSLHSVTKSGFEPNNLSHMNPNSQITNSPAPPPPQLSAINPNSSSYNRTEPFYYPCVSWSSDEDDAPLAPINEDFSQHHNRGIFHGGGIGSSQVDYGQNLAGLKYNAPPQVVVGTWGGLTDGSRGKNLESEHSFFSEETNIAGSLARSYMNQGAYDVESLSKGKEDSTMFPGRHSNLIREKNMGTSIIGKSHGTSFSLVNQGLVPNGFAKELTFSAFPEFSESHPLVVSTPEPPKEPWNSHSSYTPYGSRSIFDSYTNLKPPSITTKSLPSVVIKPPTALSNKSVEISSTANEVLVNHKPLKEKESHIPMSFEAKGSSLALNQLSFQVGRTDDRPLVDSSNKMSTDDHSDFKFKSILNFQYPDNISITKDGKSATNLSDHLDHHNPAEDSPCWKGAPTHFSPFGSLDSDPSQHPMKKRHENSVSNERISVSTPTEKDHKSGGPVVVGLDSAEPLSDGNSQASKLKLPIVVNEDVMLSGMRNRSIDGIVENAANIASAESFDVNVIVKALNNLSELLLLHCSKNESGLNEQDHNALDHIVSNLNVCMSRKVPQVPPIQNIEKLQGASPRDINLQKDHNMVQTIKKVLDENLECNEDLPTHNLLYKNLWLEAEAELCVSSYKARFHRVKREMAKSEASDPDVSEVGSDVKKISSSNFSSIAPKLIHEAADSKTSSTPSHISSLPNVDDVDSSVMARFNILKRRGEVNTEEKEHADIEGPHLPHDVGKDDAVVMHSHGNQKIQHPLALGSEDVDHSIMARLNVLKSRGESDPLNVEWQVLADDAHFQKQADDKMGFVGTSVMQNRFESGLYSPSYNASSDWEHVLKDEFS